jgi:hypothetical protein
MNDNYPPGFDPRTLDNDPIVEIPEEDPREE